LNLEAQWNPQFVAHRGRKMPQGTPPNPFQKSLGTDPALGGKEPTN
jgi:hypothetical protein